MSLFSGITKLIIGGAEIAAGVLIEMGTLGGGTPLAVMLIASGAGMVLTGVGSLLQGNPVKGFATATRNSIAPWRTCYGRVRTGGSVVYMHTWGKNDEVMDLVIVLAAHPCQSVDEVLFDQQRLQIDTSAIPTSYLAGYSIPAPAAGSGTSFTPVQQTVNITSIARSDDVVTVSLSANIPYLTAGDPIMIQNVPGDPTLNGTFQVAEIVSQTFGIPGSIVFTFLSGGPASTVTGVGQARTKWVDYGRTVYMEPLLGNQMLGHTFIGMTAGVPWQGTGKLNTPAAQPNAQGSTSDGTAGPNPWTNYCSLQGKTAVFLRIQYDAKYYPSGLPQISFHIRGKNDIYDPRLGSCTGIGAAGLAAAGSGYVAGDILSVVQSGASGGQITVTAVESGAIASYVVTAAGSGYAISTTGLAVTGGTGSGAHFTISVLTGDTSTCAYTENPVLCIADFLADQTCGYKALYGTELPAASLIASANLCDATVPLAAGGTEPRYALNGQFDLTMRRGEILQNLLTSCAGRLSFLGGQFTIQPGTWVGPGSPAVQVNLQTMAAGPMRWRPTVSIRELFNGAKGTYISPANKWQSTDFPYYAQDAQHGYTGPSQYGGDANLAADGGDRRWLELHLPFTISPSMAQRIAKIELLRRRHGGTGTFALTMAGYQFAPLDVFEATVPFLGFTDKLLEVAAARFRADDRGGVVLLGTEIDVQETDSSIYAWSTYEELTAQGYVQSRYPAGQVAESVCWPWSPGYASPLPGDALGGAASFGVQPVYGADAQGNGTVSLQIKGTPPINVLDGAVANPQLACVYSATPGSLSAGMYVVGLCAADSGSTPHGCSDFLNLCTVQVGASGSIDVTVVWGSGDDGGDLYMALWTPDGYVFHYQQSIAPGATTANLGSFNQATPGGPDPLFDHFGVQCQQEIHAGVWAQQIQARTATTITIAGAGMTANQWAGYTLSLLAKVDRTVEVPILNMPVSASTASSGGMFVLTIGPNAASVQLADLTTLLAVGDLVVMRDRPTFTPNSFQDPNIANPYYPSGDTVVEAGHVAIVLTGADTGDIQTIANVSLDGSGHSTIFDLSGTWAVTPATGDLVVVCAPSNAPESVSAPLAVSNGAVSAVVAQLGVDNLSGVVWLFRVRTEDVSGSFGPDDLAPVREIYIWGAQGPGSGAAPSAPNVTASSSTYTLTQVGTIPYFIPIGTTLTLPTGDPHYADLISITVQLLDGTSPVGVVAKINSPYTPDGSHNITWNGNQFPQSSIAKSYTLRFDCTNEDGVVSAGAHAETLAIPAANPLSPPVTLIGLPVGSEVGPVTIDLTNQLTHTRIRVTGTVATNTGNQVFGVWRSMDNGITFVGIGTFPFSGTTFSTATLGDIDSLTPGVSSSWKVAVAIGYAPIGGVSIPVANLPSNAVVSNSFTVAGIAAPIATGASGLAWSTPVYMGINSIGAPCWRSNLQGTLPGNLDPANWFTAITVECVDASGNSDPGGDLNTVPAVGTVSTLGTICLWQSGERFNPSLTQANLGITINGVHYAVAAYVNSATLTLATSAGTQVGVPYTTSGGERLYGEFVNGTGGLIRAIGGSSFTLDGNYNPAGSIYTYIRSRAWAVSRNATVTPGWKDPGAVLQTTGWGSTDHQTFAFGPAPTGTLRMDMANPSTLGQNLAVDASGKPVVPNPLDGELILNGGFDYGLQYWSPDTGNLANISVVANAGAKSPPNCLRMQTSAPYVQCEIEAKAGQTVHLFMWVSAESGSTGNAAKIAITAFDASWTSLGSAVSATTACSSAAWTQVTVDYGPIPDGTSHVLVLVQSFSTTGATLIDSVSCRRQVSTGAGTLPDGNGGVQSAATDATNLIADGTFIYGYAAWASEDAAYTLWGGTTRGTGAQCARVVGTSTGDKDLFSQPASCSAGDAFVAGALVYSEPSTNGGLVLTLQFLDVTKSTVIASVDQTMMPPFGGWVEMTVSGTAPAGASWVRLRIRAGHAMTAGAYNIDVVWMVPQVTTGQGLGPDGNGGVLVKPGVGLGFDGSGNAIVKVSGPVYTDISGNVNLQIASDFVVTGGALNVLTVNLAKSVGFDTSIFGGGGGTNLTINALAVNKLVAGDALFAGQATFAYSGGGKVTINSSGLTLADNNTSPNATVTIASSGITIARGSNSLQATSSGITISESGGAYLTAASGGIVIVKGGNSVTVNSSGVAIVGGSLTSPTISGGSLSITTSVGTVSIASYTNGIVCTSGSNVAYYTASSASVQSVSCSSLSVSGSFSVSSFSCSSLTVATTTSIGAGGMTASSGGSTLWALASLILLSNGSTSFTVSASAIAHSGLPSYNPGSGTKQFWYDPSDSNRIKYAP